MTDTSIHQDTRYIGRRTQRGTGIMVRAVKRGETVNEWFVPTKDGVISGPPKLVADGLFLPVPEREAETVLWYARRVD
jgi:hypothetical protein